MTTIQTETKMMMGDGHALLAWADLPGVPLRPIEQISGIDRAKMGVDHD
jgi:hypothetical protein